MVNTRILEQRLGWRTGDDIAPTASAPHRPILQGRVQSAQRPGLSQAPRRAAANEAWADLPDSGADLRQLSKGARAPAFDRASAAGTAMDRFRTSLMRVLADKGWRKIGVTSPTRGAGRSFVATSMAASLARLESPRVLLIDADFEAPGLAWLLGLTAPGPIDAVLTGASTPEDQLLRVGDTLALALNDAPVAHAAERMLMPDALLALRALIEAPSPDLVIFDLPPLIDNPLTQALLSQMDAVLLVADGTRTQAPDILACEQLLEGQVPLLGVALNRSEDRDPRAAARRRA